MKCLQKINLWYKNTEILEVKVRLGKLETSSITGGNRKHLIIRLFHKKDFIQINAFC